MIYIAVLCNSRITAEPFYNTTLFIGPYTHVCTLGVNDLPRVVAE